MRRSRCRVTSGRGASAPEYAIGAGLLAVLLIGGMQAVESAADRRYDEQQALVSTPVTDVGATTVPTSATTGTTATIPPTTAPPTTTSTTAAPATTTTTVGSTTTTTTPSITFTATAVSTGNNKWQIQYTVTSTAPAGNVTVSWPGGSASCSLAGRSCSGVSDEFNKNQGSRSISATGIAGFAGPTPASYTLAPPA